MTRPTTEDLLLMLTSGLVLKPRYRHLAALSVNSATSPSYIALPTTLPRNSISRSALSTVSCA